MPILECPYVSIGIRARQNKKYACILTCAVSTYIPLKGYSVVFRSEDKVLGRLSSEGKLEIMAEYACDGYSPTWRVFGKWVGTPAPRKAGLFPAIFHDFTRQFCEVGGCPWSRAESDTWFYDLMIDAGVNKHIAGVYYGAVSRTLGDIWHKFRKYDPTLTAQPQ